MLAVIGSCPSGRRGPADLGALVLVRSSGRARSRIREPPRPDLCAASRRPAFHCPEAGLAIELGQGDTAGGLQLDQPVRREQLLEVVELLWAALEAERQGLDPDGEDLRLED